ncbi:FimB/Mfa2 family fimbrial subunit [Prevotella herbatica]|uniref:FimB/Mfa2 family fimbrial subunit n=1 Tax=Prevotella herbatica TaxID=2801997 RepID=UPI001F1DE779|nr:FimB/Mfa2 family fimbrial subunit [Prevotella herbatica]
MKLRYYHNLLLLPLLSLLASCINDDYSNCVQYSLIVSQTDSVGNALGEAVKGNMMAYLFIDGKFDRIVTSDPDGSYKISYDGRLGNASLVAIGSSNKDSAQVFTPAVGTDMNSMSVSVKRDSVTGEYLLPSSLYYGTYDISSQAAGSGAVYGNIVMKNKPARLHVVIRQLKQYFGDRDYRVELSGFRSKMTYSGKITGDSIVYSPSSSFEGSDQLVTNPINTFPTQDGEYLTVSVYGDTPESAGKSRALDKTFIWDTNRDIDGKLVTLNSGDDKVIIVDCSSRKLVLTVMPWAVYTQHVVIP